MIMRSQTTSCNVDGLLRQSQMELQWIQRQLAMINARSIHHLHTKGKSKYDISSQQAAGHSTAYNVNRFRLLEEKNRALKHEVVTLRQEKQHYRKLKAKLHAALQEKNRLNLELVDHHLKASKYDQVQCDYEQLRQTFAVVSRERDVAQQQRKHLQLKVDNLEQLLKHMHEALELKQQLQTEHEQALVALHNKQREINQLQKAWLRTDQQHEEAVHLLEVKLCDLEQKCRSHSEHFHQLSKELLSFRLHSEPVEILIQNRSTPASRILSSPEEKLSEVTVEFGVQSKTGDESAANTPPLISQFLPCPTQTGDGEPSESLSVEPSTVTTDRSSSPRKPPPSEMEDETSPSPRSKPRYTGQVRLCTARYSYNPYDGPNEHPEAELPLVAGKYLYVYGDMDDDGFYEGPPLPPHDVQVLCGQAPGVLQVRWKPPVLSPTGTSNGANVIGYAVCTKGQRIAEVLVPMADYVTIDLTRIQCLEAREVIVRTLSVQGESQDSQVAVIPNNLLVPLPSIPLPAPMHPHAGPPPHPLPHPQPHLQSPHPTPQLPAPPHPQPLPPHPQHPQAHPRLPHPGRLPHPHPQPQPLHLQPCPPHQGPRPQHRLPLLPHPQPHPIPQRPVSARDLDAKEHAAHHGRALPPGHQHGWDPARSTSQPPVPMPGHTLEPPPPTNLRSPSPQRILPQPQGTLIPDTVAKAIAREAAQRVAAESGKGDRRQGRYGEQGHSFHQHPSDEEEEDEEGFAHGRRRGPSVDEFLRGSELGRPPHYSHNEEYHSESSRGSDLSDIMEEDEEELYSEMQLEEGGRRRNSHNTPKSNSPAGGRHDRDGGRRTHSHLKRRPLMVPSIEVTSENNSEGNLSSVTEEVNYGRVARHRKWSSRRHMGGTRSPHDGYRNRDRRSPTYYDESEPEEHFRIFVALFDYDPLSMSPNPDAADEELPFKEGQIIKIYGDKDTDGFYRGEVKGRMGLIPCNMVSEIRADDEETMDHLIKQGFLPLSTPVDKIEQNRRGLRRDQASRRMVALYDYDPRESSPNVDVEAELTFCAGDIIAVFGDIDEDGFYYGELNGHRGLVPSNFLEEVPDDVEVYLTDTPSHYPQEEPANRPPANSAAAISEGKRVTAETTGTANNISTPVRAPSPIVRPLLPGTMRPLSPPRGPHVPLDPRDPQDLKKKKGILSKGKKLLKRLSPVK
ncbi:RIMS-binding protein 2 isoform X8 [Kryptolebias marmoratus]|uniref:RIMS-binding protein 2 isoform X8 n=1 Tax=Kryptolebias marmoratus TaxID=37003 RepID=UPI0018AD03C9|nr:RIMS-binding protein 2 isoform X8 [Kryptolebias marmoratus]